MKKFGFTLAETLITLGIIGIVAAMTIPNLITEHQKRASVTKLQRAISVINQATDYLLTKWVKQRKKKLLKWELMNISKNTGHHILKF